MARLSCPVTIAVDPATGHAPASTLASETRATAEVGLLVDPSAGFSATPRPPLRRTSRLGTVGMIDISKPGGSVLLDYFQTTLANLSTPVTCRRYCKPTFSRPAPADLLEQIRSECDVAVVALADWGSCTTGTLHDVARLEAAGIPTVGLLSEGFVSQGLHLSATLGLLEPERLLVVVSHPISNATPSEMEAKAAAAYPQVLRALTSNRPAPALVASGKLSEECAAGAWS